MLSSSRPADSARILILDDDRDTVESMARLLGHFGYKVQIATDGYQAIEIGRQQRPTHVLLDLAMPDLDGYKVASRLRQELPGPFRLIAITGHGQQEDRRRTLAAGFDHHLVKPIDLDDLLSLLCVEDSGIWVRQSEPGTDPSPVADEGGVGVVSLSNGAGEGPSGGEIAPDVESASRAMA